MKSIYRLELHETIRIEKDGYYVRITRVPGGWLYKYDDDESATFVPMNSEFTDTGVIKNEDNLGWTQYMLYKK